VTVTDGQTALVRLADVDPDVILADAFLPRRTGVEICEFVKSQPRFRYIRVVLTAGMLEELKDEDARRIGADGVVRKPFEASTMVKLLKGLAAEAGVERSKLPPELLKSAPPLPSGPPAPEPPPPSRFVPPQPPAPPAVASAASIAVALRPVPKPAPAPEPADPERVRAAVTLALDAAMPQLIDIVTEQVLAAIHPPKTKP
jgi:twitching motility two-component system response regulator PilG/twitching motility two-component system response regulator PilH